ncbi:MAG: nucleotidyltransferase domain-containing protein [Candidatus Micrarchaeota archaeon]
MLFRDFGERLLGSKVKLRLLSHLLAPYSDGQFFALPPASQREFAQLIDVSHTAVANAFEDFYNTNLVHPAHVGSSKMWIINGDSYAFEVLTHSPLTALFRQPPLVKLESMIRETFSKHQGIVESAVIYGSIAKKTESPSSDIDLMLLVKTPNAEKVLQSDIEKLDLTCRKLFGNNLSKMVSEKFVSADFSGFQPEWFADALDNGINVML